VAATVRSFNTYGSTVTETGPVVPMPSGWQAGDVVYIGWELTASSGTVSDPSGWSNLFTHFRSSGTTNSLHGVYRRVMQGGDGNDVTFTVSSGRFAAVSVAIQGADTTTPEDVTPTTDDNASVVYPDVRAPSIDPAASDCLLLTFHALRNGTNGATTTFAPPSGMSEQGDATSNVAATSNAAVECASLALSSGDATGTKTATATSSSGTTINQMGSAVAVRAAAVGGPAPTPPITVVTPQVVTWG
jgi:hypothetical protein